MKPAATEERRSEIARYDGAEPMIALSALRYTAQAQDLQPYNLLEPLHGGGEAFPAMLAAIRAARRTILLETYIFHSDGVGHAFAKALAERAEAGVEVRFMYDSFGCFSCDEDVLVEMERAGVELVEYNPIRPWRKRFKLVNRNHRKVLVIDGDLAFTGGLNIGEEYDDEVNGGGGWRDTHLCVRGPIARDLARLYRLTWIDAGGEPFELLFDEGEVRPPAPIEETALAVVIANERLGDRFRFRRSYLQAIRAARRTVSIMNAYFLPGRAIRRALRKAVARGVEVRVIVPGNSDVKAVQHATAHLYGQLLRWGVRVFEWPKTMMHAKTAVIDGLWSKIGSYNLDNASLRLNLEVAVAIIDDRFGERMDEHFEQDVAKCEEVTLERWKSRSLWQKVVGWLFYRVRRFL